MELMDLLERLKLNKYEKNAYLALYSLDEANSRQLCKESKVPYGRIYDIMKSLEDKGLVSVIDAEPKTFKIIDPKKAFDNYLERERDDLLGLKEQLNKMVLPKRVFAFKSKIEDVIIVKGKPKMRKIKDVMTETAKKELMVTHFSMNQMTTKELILKERMINRGVVDRIILSELIKQGRPKVKKAVLLGTKIKMFPIWGLRFMIKDREEAMICIVDNKTNDYISVYSKHKDFAESLGDFFDSIWEKGKELTNL